MGWVSCRLVGYLCTCTIVWLSVRNACQVAWTVGLILGESDVQSLCDMVYEFCV